MSNSKYVDRARYDNLLESRRFKVTAENARHVVGAIDEIGVCFGENEFGVPEDAALVNTWVCRENNTIKRLLAHEAFPAISLTENPPIIIKQK